MKDSIFARLAVATLVVCSTGCKLRVELPEGGAVHSASGAFDCSPDNAVALSAQRRALHGSGLHAAHDDNLHCDFEITDTSFEESFTAVPDPGYRFSHWKRSERSLMGNSSEATVNLATTSFGTNETLLSVLASDLVFHLEPVFTRVNSDGNDLDCEGLQGSFDRIQTVVFEGYNCTNSACHGGGASAGGLALDRGVAYDNLVRVEAAANLVEPQQLVYPGEQRFSFLYNKLAAATRGTALPDGGGLPMPIGAPALSEDHLEALLLWIRNGAPETNDVDDVASLLGCQQPTEPAANKIDPPPFPAKGKGVQFVSGPWTVPPNAEGEVCYATYYDLEKTPGLLPNWAKTPCQGGVFSDYDGSCFASNLRTLTQDPQSHHSIINVYTGAVPFDDPSWGTWQCLNGEHVGKACDPRRINVSAASGGGDCGGEHAVCGTEPVPSIACRGWGPQDLSFKAVDMGGAQSPVSEQRLAEGVYAVLPTRGVIAWNSHAFNLSSKATTVEQYNDFYFAPADQRDYRSRGIFDAKDILVARVPPFTQRTYCSTHTLPVGTRLTQLSSHAHKRGILWQTWLPPQDPRCTVQTDCQPSDGPADYVSRVYNDPLYLDYDPPIALDSLNTADRTLKFCVTYDNGAEYPELLKRNSTSVGTTCRNNAYCVGGPNEGEFCGNQDSMCGAGGACDACIVRGGFTTEDEMFLLLGNFYVVPEAERNR